MNNNNLLLKYDKDLRIRMMYPEARREINGDVVRFIRQAPGMNFVSFTFANESNLERVIGEQTEYLAHMDQPFTWKVYDHDRLPTLKNRLASQKFVEDNDPGAIMVLDVKNAPIHKVDLTKADIRRITDRNCLKDVVYVLDKVYGGSNHWVYDRLGMHLSIPGYLSVYVAYVEKTPVSIAWTYFPRGQFATLFGGTTLAEHRGRGLYTTLLHLRLEEIRERGYSFAVVEAGPMSKPIVEKHGFKHLTTVWDYVWQGS